jgi:hypothetical protein
VSGELKKIELICDERGEWSVSAFNGVRLFGEPEPVWIAEHHWLGFPADTAIKLTEAALRAHLERTTDG